MMQNNSEPQKHTIAVLVENRFGVLSRVAGLFSARGYNIESLSVGETLDPTVSRMTLVVRGDEFVIEQVVKQLHKLIDVIKVIDLTREDHVERELVLVRVNAEPQHRAEILRTADLFRGKVRGAAPPGCGCWWGGRRGAGPTAGRRAVRVTADKKGPGMPAKIYYDQDADLS